ncbi:unnamed protein product [Peronospora belbahrii]|uniref:Uncharacterized protein n=1 Tax=Peronospora belbahrii TaxID=622444 RepID=A0AAU9L547_9STRA|nr:unnamed protein product [Peronospora belbahrii]
MMMHGTGTESRAVTSSAKAVITTLLQSHHDVIISKPGRHHIILLLISAFARWYAQNCVMRANPRSGNSVA